MKHRILLATAAFLTLPMCSAFAEEYDTTPAPAEQAKAPAVSKVKEVIVVCKTHFDLGYTHRVKDLIPYYRTAMIDRALLTMDKSSSLPKDQQFAWTAPGWVMAKVLEDWEGQTPERAAKLDTAFKDGKFVVHALPFTLESDACEAEEMARGLVFSSQLARQTGKPLPTAAKVTDVPGHSNALSTVLAQGGVKFLHIGCNWPAAFVKTPGLFWWEGPDGSRTLTMYSVLYGSCTAMWPKKWLGSDPEPQTGQGLLPPSDWPYTVWPAIIVTPDNTGPPSEKSVQAYFADAQKKMPGVKFRMGTMEEFAAAILKENADIPVVKAQMPDTWIHGILSDPEGCKLSREAHSLIASAEAQRSQLQGWGITLPTAKDQVATAYENILLYGEHTFGGATAINKYGDDFKNAKQQTVADLEGSWEDKTNYIRKAHTIAKTLTAENLQALADGVKAVKGKGVVYNPLPWKRTEMVNWNGSPVLLSDIPACGYKIVNLPLAMGVIPHPPASTSPCSLENAFFKVTLDPQKGTITSIVDKRNDREWLDSTDHGVGYFNERFSYKQTHDYVTANMADRTRGAFESAATNSWLHPNMYKPGLPANVPYRAASPMGGRVEFESRHVAHLYTPSDPSNHLPAIGLKVSLLPGQPFVDLELSIQGKAKDNWPEADWLRLPFKVEKPRFSVARALGEMNPATDILPGANRDMYTVGHGVTITGDDGAGVAVCPLDHPLISLDRPGCWRFSHDFTPSKPEVFVNLYNNQWNTNFRYWFPGSWSSRVRLWTFDADTAAHRRLAVPALEARNPLQIVISTSTGGTLPAEQSGITVSRPGTLVTAFGPDPDGHPGTLLRVWEQAGMSGNLTLTLPTGFKTGLAQPVDLRGENVGEPVKITDGKLTFSLNAYAPASFILKNSSLQSAN